MEQKIITARLASELNRRISEMQREGWEPIGSHFVVVTREQKRFAGSQHKDTVFEHEYSQTMKFNGEAFVKKIETDKKQKDRQEKIENDIKSILDKKEKGIDCSEEDSSELKEFVNRHFNFVQHFGEDHSSIKIKELFDRIQRVFPIEFAEAIEEAGL
jgi:ribosomal protein L13